MPQAPSEALGPPSLSLEYAVAPAMPLDIPKPSFVQACVLRFALLLNSVFGGLHPDIALLIIWYLQGLIWLDVFAPSGRSSQQLHNSHREMAFNPDDTPGIREDRVCISPVQTHTSTETHEAAAGENNGSSQSPCHSPSIDIGASYLTSVRRYIPYPLSRTGHGESYSSHPKSSPIATEDDRYTSSAERTPISSHTSASTTCIAEGAFDRNPPISFRRRGRCR